MLIDWFIVGMEMQQEQFAVSLSFQTEDNKLVCFTLAKHPMICMYLLTMICLYCSQTKLFTVLRNAARPADLLQQFLFVFLIYSICSYF
eukprot:g43765.t1